MRGKHKHIIACMLMTWLSACDRQGPAEATPAPVSRPSLEQHVAWFRQRCFSYVSKKPLMASEEVYKQRAREFDAALERTGVDALRDLRMIALARLLDDESRPGTSQLLITLFANAFVPTRLEVLEESGDAQLTPVAQVPLETFRSFFEAHIGGGMMATFMITVVPSAYDSDATPADVEQKDRPFPVLRFDARRATGRLVVRLSDDAGRMTDSGVLCMYTPEELKQERAKADERERQWEEVDRALDAMPIPNNIPRMSRRAATSPVR
jgi:hypothetical protein